MGLNDGVLAAVDAILGLTKGIIMGVFLKLATGVLSLSRLELFLDTGVLVEGGNI